MERGASREMLSTFAVGVIVVSLIAFLITATPASGRDDSASDQRGSMTLDEGRPSDSGLAPDDIDIGTPVSIEKLVTETPVDGGGIRVDVAVANHSPSDVVTIHELTDATWGDIGGRGTCEMPQAIDPNEVYRCWFAG